MCTRRRFDIYSLFTEVVDQCFNENRIMRLLLLYSVAEMPDTGNIQVLTCFPSSCSCYVVIECLIIDQGPGATF